MLKVIQGTYKTTSQIALEDPIFQELFGNIWHINKFIVNSPSDISWAVFYKDYFLQAVSDYVNYGYKDNISNETDRQETIDWIFNFYDDTFSDIEKTKELILKINLIKKNIESKTTDKSLLYKFNNQYKKVKAYLNNENALSFGTCCDILGIDKLKARQSIELYRNLKVSHGHKIRIVHSTGSCKNMNIPTIKDIIDSREANSKDSLFKLLHSGVQRKQRNEALARRDNERRCETDSK